MRLWVCVLAVLAVAGCGGKSHASRASLTVTPARGLADTAVTVRASGLEPHAAVILRASWAGFRERADSAIGLRADGDGRIQLRGFDGDRFLWGMRSPTLAFALPDTEDSVVRLALTEGGKVVARGEVHRRVGVPGLRVRELTAGRDGLVGVFYAPTTARRRGAVLAIGGSGGGLQTIDVAALLASHGHPTLALAYFRAPGLPSELRRIPLEYFERALRWLARQPSVDRAHITTLGLSRGGEPALLSAIHFPRLVHGVIALVPEPEVALALDNRTPAWTYRGKALGPQPIAVERIHGPILMASAGEDSQAPSSDATRRFEARLRAHRFAFFHERLDYPRAGHDIASAIPYLPQPDPIGVGGTPSASARAKTDLWPRILDFLDDHAQ